MPDRLRPAIPMGPLLGQKLKFSTRNAAQPCQFAGRNAGDTEGCKIKDFNTRCAKAMYRVPLPATAQQLFSATFHQTG
jgi:hypothetical protein